MSEQLIKLKAVMERTGRCRSACYHPDFPKPIKVGKRASAWVASEIDRWIQDTIKAQRAEGSEQQHNEVGAL